MVPFRPRPPGSSWEQPPWRPSSRNRWYPARSWHLSKHPITQKFYNDKKALEESPNLYEGDNLHDTESKRYKDMQARHASRSR